jgi:rubrerythrin
VKLQEAITIALDFEKKVRDHYLRGAKDIPDPRGRKVFATLGKEEQGHVDYLGHCLAEWKRTGKVPDAPLRSILPKGSKWIAAELKKLDGKGKRVPTKTEVEALRVALQHEREADAFYHKLVASLGAEDRTLFSKFLEIEDGHLAIVQAQLDSVQGIGFWFDVAEFKLEAQ